MGLGLDRVGPSLCNSSRPTPDGLNSLGHRGFKAKIVGEESGLKHGPLLRPPMPFEGRSSISSDSNIDEEGNKEHSREEGEIREDLPQDDDCVYMKRYEDNLNYQSPSSRFSVFGRPLLPGGFSGLGGGGGYLWV